MEREAVASFVEQASGALAATASLGKRNTELRVVEPFLSTLDWDVRSAAVTAAYSAPNGTTVDYALRPEGVVGAFVTVSAAEDGLSIDRRDELVATMRAAEVPRGVYTNGRRYVLVALDPESDEGSVEYVALELAELPERLGALEALSYDAVAAAVGSDGAAAADALVAADQDAVDAVTETVVDVARDHADEDLGDVTGDVRPLARRFLDAVVEELAPEATDATRHSDAFDDGDVEGGTATDRDDHRTPARGEESAEDDASDGDLDSNRNGDGDGVRSMSAASASDDGSASTEFVVRFFEDGRSVGAVGNPEVDAAVAQAVQYLLEERGVGPRIQLPYAPVSDDRAFLHRKPVHPDGDRMGSAVDLDGVYVATDAPVEDLQSAVEALAERGGLRVMFSGDWP